MGLFRRRKNKWVKDVIINETQIENDKIDESVAGDIVYRESALTNYPDSEFASDFHSSAIDNAPYNTPDCRMEGGLDSEFGADIHPGVTENAPYHNTSDYRMVGGYDKGSDTVINSQSS